MVLHELSEFGVRGDFNNRGVRLSITHPEHSYDTVEEFNRRRVSSGYSIGLSNVRMSYRSESRTGLDLSRNHRARNVNIGGEFLTSTSETR